MTRSQKIRKDLNSLGAGVRKLRGLKGKKLDLQIKKVVKLAGMAPFCQKPPMINELVLKERKKR